MSLGLSKKEAKRWREAVERNRRAAMTEEQIKHMVQRFLGWRLPKPWNPDNGISYQRPNYAHAPADHDWPTGTNLFDANQTEAMIRHMLKPETFSKEDFEEVAKSLRNARDDQHFKAILSNNHNVILAALDKQSH
jgi:hypothetical protein